MKNNNLTTFVIVRHGETDWNKKKLIQGQTDIALNKTGERQAKELAEKFSDRIFELAFSSDLLRAKRTTEIIALEKNLAVETTNALRERIFGKWEGKPSQLLFDYLKTLKEKSDEERKKYKVHEDFESDEELATRIITFLREIAVTNPGKMILIGTHGGVLHVILVHLGFMTYQESDNLRIKNSGYLTLQSDGVDFFIKETVGLQSRKTN